MTVREIQGFLAEMYAVDVSPDLISTVTDGVVAEVTAWQRRPLERMYPVVFFDAHLARAAQHHGEMGARATLLETGDESIRDPLRRSLFPIDGVKCHGAWTLPEPWTHRTRPPLLGKPPRTRFPTAPTRIIV
jgi:hypothetical protein